MTSSRRPLPSVAARISIATVVMASPSRESRMRQRPPTVSSLRNGTIAAEVFGRERPRGRGLALVLGLLVVGAGHAVAGAAMWRTASSVGSVESVEERPPMVVEMMPEPEPEMPPPEVEPPPEDVPPPRDDAPPPPKAEPSPKASSPEPEPSTEQGPPPAQAGKVLTADAADPLDFTGFDIVSGQGASYVGGVTSSRATGKHASTAGRGNGGRGEGGGGRAPPSKSLARPVTLPSLEWRDCPWPDEANALGIDEQVVTLRVVADAGGKVTSVEVLADPGYGFGPQARTCAFAKKWLPALDDAGQPYAATSPVYRFEFTR